MDIKNDPAYISVMEELPTTQLKTILYTQLFGCMLGIIELQIANNRPGELIKVNFDAMCNLGERLPDGVEPETALFYLDAVRRGGPGCELVDSAFTVVNRESKIIDSEGAVEEYVKSVTKALEMVGLPGEDQAEKTRQAIEEDHKSHRAIAFIMLKGAALEILGEDATAASYVPRRGDLRIALDGVARYVESRV